MEAQGGGGGVEVGTLGVCASKRPRLPRDRVCLLHSCRLASTAPGEGVPSRSVFNRRSRGFAGNLASTFFTGSVKRATRCPRRWRSGVTALRLGLGQGFSGACVPLCKPTSLTFHPILRAWRAPAWPRTSSPAPSPRPVYLQLWVPEPGLVRIMRALSGSLC